MNTKVLRVNVKEVSFTSRGLIIDSMSIHKLVPQLFPITKKSFEVSELLSTKV